MTSQKVTPIIDPNNIKEYVHIRSPFEKYSDKIIELLLTSKALMHGHFSLLSGLHTDIFLRFNNICKSPEHVEFISKLLANEANSSGKYDAVISPDTAGVLLAYEISKILGIERVTASTDQNNMPNDIINYVDLKPQANVLIVNDMTTTTYGLKKLIQLIKKYGATPSKILLFAIRDEKEKPEIIELSKQYPISAIIDLKVKGHEFASKDNCPVCIDSKGEDLPIESWMIN